MGENATSGFGQRLRNFIKKKGNVVIFLFIWVMATGFVPGFATVSNNLNIIKQAAIPAITCIGMTFVLMTGGIDLSLGYTVGLCSYVFGQFAMLWNINPIFSMILTVVVGMLWGLCNGVLVQYAKIPAFIVTLGTGYIAYGLAQILSNGAVLSNIPKNILLYGRAQFFGLTASVYYALVVMLIFYYVLHKSTFGRSLSSLGLNIETTKLSGINVAFVHVMAYVVCGALAGFSAILMTLRVNSASPVMGGMDYTFEAITAAIIGGASLSGGAGSVWGSILGVFTIIIIENGINLLGVNYYFYKAVLSILVLAAMIFESLKNRKLQ